MTALDYPRIRGVLPHGHGMVLLYRVDELVPGERIVAVKAVSGGELCYAGLAPDAPAAAYAYPVSLLLESFGQAAAVLWLSGGQASRRVPDEVLMLAAARDCRFERPAYPGDLLRHVVRLEHRSDGATFVSGHTERNGELVASYGSLTAVVRARAQLPPADGQGTRAPAVDRVDVQRSG
jgi:3-hydroxyacyl-[acyl-carrier-protein] dehydratase